MKLLTLFTLLFMGYTSTNAQNDATQKLRYISIIGSAEMNIQPNEIELEIVFKEYEKNDEKINLDAIEDEFYKTIKKNKIDKKNVLFGQSNYYWYYWWTYRNDDLKRKTLTLKLTPKTNLLKLVKDLDQPWVESLRISKSTHTKLQEFRKEIKIKAIKAAKEKANYLLESIGEKTGKVISIEEVPDYSRNNWYYWEDRLSNQSINTNQHSNEIENIAAIKLRCEIKAVFEIE